MYEIITEVIDDEALEHVLSHIRSAVFKRSYPYYFPKVMLFCNEEGLAVAAADIKHGETHYTDYLWQVFSAYSYISHEEYLKLVDGLEAATGYYIGHAVRVKPFKVSSEAIADSYMNMSELPDENLKIIEKLIKR